MKPRSGGAAHFAHFVFDHLFAPLPSIVQNLAIVWSILVLVPPIGLLRYEFSVFQRIRNLNDVVEVAAILVIWGGVFILLDWQIAAAVMAGPLFAGFALISIVFATHGSEHSLNSLEPRHDEYELMIFNITNLTMGTWLDRIGHYFHRYHIEHHLFPSIPFHGLAKASEFVQREYGQYMLPVRKLNFDYIKRGYLDNTRNYIPIDIAGRRYFVGSFFDDTTIGERRPTRSDKQQPAAVLES